VGALLRQLKAACSNTITSTLSVAVDVFKLTMSVPSAFTSLRDSLPSSALQVESRSTLAIRSRASRHVVSVDAGLNAALLRAGIPADLSTALIGAYSVRLCLHAVSHNAACRDSFRLAHQCPVPSFWFGWTSAWNQVTTLL
jgi:hypothetical protein